MVSVPVNPYRTIFLLLLVILPCSSPQLNCRLCLDAHWPAFHARTLIAMIPFHSASLAFAQQFSQLGLPLQCLQAPSSNHNTRLSLPMPCPSLDLTNKSSRLVCNGGLLLQIVASDSRCLLLSHEQSQCQNDLQED